jgi:hypothetical protein
MRSPIPLKLIPSLTGLAVVLALVLILAHLDFVSFKVLAGVVIFGVPITVLGALISLVWTVDSKRSWRFINVFWIVVLIGLAWLFFLSLRSLGGLTW